MPAITTRGLTKYYGKARGIVDVNLQVEEGEVFGFIGPNGAGKSTTIRTLLNFIRPTKGKAEVFAHNTVTESQAIKRLVGYLPAEVNYYDHMTSLQLLRYSARFYGPADEKRMRELAERFELDLNRRFIHLSFGNRKKVGIIQAVLHRPRLLILDEPTGGLDPLMQQRFFDLVQEENAAGATVFLSSHVLSEVQRLCRRVGIIKDGRLIQVEEIDKLREKLLKHLHLEFGAGETKRRLDLPSLVGVTVRDNYLDAMYSGSINTLTRALAGRDIVNLWIEEPTLEEIFIHYYEGETKQE